MIRYLIKNNLKLMLRSKWILVVMILGPLLVIAVLSSAFDELLKSYEGVDAFHAGYRLETDSMQEYAEQIREAGKEIGITFHEYPEGDVKELMEHNDLAGFVEIGADAYTVYESADYAAEGITLEYFMSRVMTYGMEQALRQVTSADWENETALPVQELAYMPAVNSQDYYGIAQIVYFSWVGIICIAGVLTSEKKNGIGRKYQVSPVSGFMLYMGKWIPLVLVLVLGIGAAILTSILLLGIHWGNPLMSALIIVLLCMASAAFGLMLYSMTENLGVTVVILFSAAWFMGFFGGCFETYMFSGTSDTLKNLSPIYHINRVLVEYSCMGQSTHTAGCILYMLAIVLVCSAAAVAAAGIRRRGRA